MTTSDSGWNHVPATEQGPFPTDREKALAELLARAGGPGTTAELRREAEAVALFRSIVPVTTTPERRPTVVHPRIRPRILVAGLSVLATGGLFATATAGGLTSSFRSPDRPTAHPSGTLASRITPTKASATVSGPTTGGLPAQTVPGLCRFWLLAAEPDSLAGVPLFRPVVAAAGGSERVRAYCESRVGTPPSCPVTSPVTSRDALSGMPDLPEGPLTEVTRPDSPPVDPAALPQHWPSTGVDDWPASWPDTWPIPKGRDASSWTSWPAWISFCAEATRPATTTSGCRTGEPDCSDRTPTPHPEPTASGWPRSGPDTCDRPGDTPCQPDSGTADRPVQDQLGPDGHGWVGEGARGER